MECQNQIYWRPDLGSGVPYTLEKLALEYKENRVSGDVEFRRGSMSGPFVTFHEILRTERELQRMIGEASLPETLDADRGAWDEFRHRVGLFRQIVRDGDFSPVEFVRRLETVTEEKNAVTVRAEQTERCFEEEQHKSNLLQRQLGVACRALRDTVAGLEFSLKASTVDRESLAAALHETLCRILVAIGDENSPLAITDDEVKKLLLIYQVEAESNARVQESIKQIAVAQAQQQEDIRQRKDEFRRYCASRERLFTHTQNEAIKKIQDLTIECQHVLSAVGRLRSLIARMVKAHIRPAWRVWVRNGDTGIPACRLGMVVWAFGPKIAPRDVVAIADATPLGSCRYGIVLTFFAIHVRDATQYREFKWGNDVSIVVESVRGFSLFLRVNGFLFKFRLPYFGKFRAFLKQLSNLCRVVSIPSSVLMAVEEVYSFDKNHSGFITSDDK